jgi:NhaP-type Na+/H+ or K+/H+ antiporter
MVALGLIACALFGYALFSRRVEGTIVTGPMLFVAAGLACGWTGLVDFGSAAHGGDHEAAREVVFLVAELALVLLLFTDAARIDPRALRRNPLPARLLGIGLPLTVALGALVGLWYSRTSSPGSARSSPPCSPPRTPRSARPSSRARRFPSVCVRRSASRAGSTTAARCRS